MTQEELKQLQRGDIVQNIGSGTSYVVESHYGDWIIGVRTVTITHLSEWRRVSRPETPETER